MLDSPHDKTATSPFNTSDIFWSKVGLFIGPLRAGFYMQEAGILVQSSYEYYE